MRATAVVLCMVLCMVLGMAVLVSPTPTRAQDATREPFDMLSGRAGRGPITIRSDSLELDYRGATLTYVGTVHVTQGDLVLTSDRLQIAFHQGALDGTAVAEAPRESGREVRDRIREIVAAGNVRIEQENRVATGQRAVFDHAAQTIVLSDGALLEEGPNQVSGARIVVYLNEQRSVVESGAESRVQAVLYPDTVDADAVVPASQDQPALADSGAREAPREGDGLP